jgi:putative endonuclease
MPRAKQIETVDSWYVYIVRCADASLYTGVTNRVDTRVAMHNAGRGARYTRSRRPVELVYLESVEDRSAALRREAQIKRLPADRKRELVGRRGG